MVMHVDQHLNREKHGVQRVSRASKTMVEIGALRRLYLSSKISYLRISAEFATHGVLCEDEFEVHCTTDKASLGQWEIDLNLVLMRDAMGTFARLQRLSEMLGSTNLRALREMETHASCFADMWDGRGREFNPRVGRKHAISEQQGQSVGEWYSH